MMAHSPQIIVESEKNEISFEGSAKLDDIEVIHKPSIFKLNSKLKNHTIELR